MRSNKSLLLYINGLFLEMDIWGGVGIFYRAGLKNHTASDYLLLRFNHLYRVVNTALGTIDYIDKTDNSLIFR